MAGFALPRLLGLGALALAALPSAAQEPAKAPDAERFVRVGARGADLRNVADRDGITLVRRDSGSVLAVFGKRAGWLEVEIPGGFPVWVYGRFLRPTGDGSVYEVTGDGINLRPRPSRDVTNFPLSGRLHTGDRVAAIQRNDGSLPLAEDWVRVWSPPGIHAWVAEEDTRALSAGEDGAALWLAGLAQLAEGRGKLPSLTASAGAASGAKAPAGTTGSASEPSSPSEATTLGSTTAAPASAPTAEQQAIRALEDASEALALQRRAEQPDFVTVRAAYDRVLDLAPGGMAAQLARQGLETVAALESAAALKEALALERARREGELQDRQDEIWEATRRRDPLHGRYDGRGVLERRTIAGAAPRYYLRRGGEDVFEVTCDSKRYNLDLFAGFEVGIQGASAQESGRLDVERLFVLSRR